MFYSKSIASFFEDHTKELQATLEFTDILKFDAAKEELEVLKNAVNELEREKSTLDDDSLNELFVFKKLLDLIDAYSLVWNKISAGEFSSSWITLQDALDSLRLIKKFSDPPNHRVEFFESQLLELEKLYPYDIFVSIGATVDWFQCSICGKDIDSFECPHLMGELYRGRMAYGIAQNLKNADHVAFVSHPEDKRCVILYEDSGPQFKIIRYLGSSLKQKKITPLQFLRAEFKKIKVKDSDYVPQPRNEICTCGSGLKFKKCCIKKKYIETDHVEIVTGQTACVFCE